MTGWMEQAACRGLDPELFHPDKGSTAQAERAKAVCATCPVRSECLEYGMHTSAGIYGGATPRDRRRILGPHVGLERECGCGAVFVVSNRQVRCAACQAELERARRRDRMRVARGGLRGPGLSPRRPSTGRDGTVAS